MDITISMVALGENAKISADRISKAWSARWPKPPRPADFEKKDNTLSFRVDDCQVFYGLMPAPIPWSDLEWPCANAIFWPEATAEMRKHARHVIVTVMGDAERVGQMNVLTQATVALADSCDAAIGVYWCNSRHVIKPEKFADLVCRFIPDGVPLPVWVNFRVGNNDDGTSSGFTKGLEAFDLMEFETETSPESPGELRDRLVGLAEYVIRNGPVIKDGDTIGEDAKERIKVDYKKSAFGGDGDVMRLEYGEAESSGSRLTTYGWIHAVATLLCTAGFGYILYAFVPLLRGSFFRHFLFVPAILVFGFVLLLVSDNFLQKTFGLEAFDEPKDE